MARVSTRDNAGGGIADGTIETIAPRLGGGTGGRSNADRAFIAGRSGSGKTYLAQELLRLYGPTEPAAFRGYLVVVDPNHTMDVMRDARLVDAPGDIRPTKQAPVIHYRPSVEGQSAEGWNTIWKLLFEQSDPIMVYVDETYAMEPLFLSRRLEGGRNYLTAYLTQGRARGKGAILSAQRPVSIPRNVVAQAEWFYVFDLPLEDDRREMAGVIGRWTNRREDLLVRETLAGPGRRYNFAHLQPGLSAPIRLKLVK